MYSNQIMEEFYNTECYGNMRGASGVGKVVCSEGDEIIKIFIVVEKGVITQAEFQTFGGVVAIALTSFANRFILNKEVDKARKITVNDILKMAGEVPENRMYLAHAVVAAARLAIDNIGKKSKED
ncbi:MAG: iron-sulfur cluster assembly scaffold protein [Clostridia bacterium]|nr:iron-sulfur cluster assembly scaffold protein [Clostridia bacterium]